MPSPAGQSAILAADAADSGRKLGVPAGRGERRFRTGRVAEAPARGRKAKPDLSHVVFRRQALEQCRRPCIVMAETNGRQRQRQGFVLGCQPAGALQPALRLRGAGGCNFGLSALERIACEGRDLGRLGQRPTAWGSACCAPAGGGKAARSLRASCNPCASARSSQTRARSASRSPARPRAR